MFLRRVRVRKNGKAHSYWALVKSVRTPRGPRQELVSYLGELTPTEQTEYARVRRVVAEAGPVQKDLFDPKAGPEWVQVDVRRVRVERGREFGSSWLALKLWQALELDRLLERCLPGRGEEIRWGLVGCILTVARLDSPGSELAIEERWYEQTALADLLGVPAQKVNTDRLYRALDALWPHKPEMERHLRDRYRSLFDSRFDLLIYDLTSSYFEGLEEKNDLAARGYSRDHRPDCKQVVIALVVTQDGLPLAFEVFEGNRHDAKTLPEMVTAMEAKHGEMSRVWVFDRGVVSEENLEWLRARQATYLVGTPRSMVFLAHRQAGQPALRLAGLPAYAPKTLLKRHEAALREQGWNQVYEDIEVKAVPGPEGKETFLLCRARARLPRRRSQARRQKEAAMHRRFVERIEAGLGAI